MPWGNNHPEMVDSAHTFCPDLYENRSTGDMVPSQGEAGRQDLFDSVKIKSITIETLRKSPEKREINITDASTCYNKQDINVLGAQSECV